jgi:hypothetical protein
MLGFINFILLTPKKLIVVLFTQTQKMHLQLTGTKILLTYNIIIFHIFQLE